MTNGERILSCKSPEEIAYIHFRLKQYAIYADGRLLSSTDPDDFVIWLNKESDNIDDDIFSMKPHPCSKCGGKAKLIEPDYTDPGYCIYQCSECGYTKYPNYDEYQGSLVDKFPKSNILALLIWNY